MDRVTWMKKKYSSPKQRGRFAASEHPVPKRKRNKNTKHDKSKQRQMVMVLQTNGKIGWVEQ